MKYLREKHGYKQMYIQMNIGIYQCDYSRLETGEEPMSFEQCKRLAILYHTSMDFINGLTDEETPHKRKINK